MALSRSNASSKALFELSKDGISERLCDSSDVPPDLRTVWARYSPFDKRYRRVEIMQTGAGKAEDLRRTESLGIAREARC